MAQPYVGEIRMFAGNFPPAGWEFCEGQLISISENETLFQLIGTTYGGDGESTFGLPDLRGRIPIHQGNGFMLSDKDGAEDVTLTVNEIPAHSHLMQASGNVANTSLPANAVLAASSQVRAFFGEPPGNQTMDNSMLIPVGGSQPHSNMQPYLCINFIISMFGIFPSST
jgi:microcystin-dependent protein